jgi:hypothetical protein
MPALEPLNGDELRLVRALRDIPSDARRARVLDLGARLARLVRDPGCAQMQADGVPCDNASTACADCEDADGLLRFIEGRIART